ncbi:unnamed protein product [Triticum turgidum subsp. durum]|uniref:PHD finger protein ING n=1 Tax=Triticum turgidum subsp. durum TaxID=4567 RepID=A0A9R0TC48_TRITD|nr:unnamed protein product [Triticum turgidum subsp. durum]
MGFLEDFQASVETLPAMLHKNYSLMRELDKSLQGVQLENEQRCQQEIEDIKHGLESGSITTYEPAAADTAVAATSAAPAGAGSLRSAAADPAPKTGRAGERSRGGRKKAKVPTEMPTEMPMEQPAIDLELPVDPNEPTYCFCNQVSYGEMVACDNPDCKIEWFHFGCVGLKEQPRGKWYCLSCSAFQKKRKGR